MKRLLLLSSLIFGLALSGCGNSNPGTENDQEKATLGQPCSESKKCADKLVCVADAGKTDTGTCQTECPSNTCSDMTKQCQNVDGLNSKKVNACLAPTGIKEGEECRATDTCETGTYCVAKYGRDDVGFCTRATDCSSNASVCTNGDSCQEVNGIGGKTLKFCEPTRCSDSNKCTNTGDICVSDGINRTYGHCKPSCDPDASTCPTGQTCVHVSKYTPYYSPTAKGGICMPDAEAAKPGFNETCKLGSACRDQGMVCVKAKAWAGKISHKCAPACENIGFGGECKSDGGWTDFCLEWMNGVKACGPIFDESKYYTQEAEQPCGVVNGALKLCKQGGTTELKCVLTEADVKEGKCKEWTEKECNGLTDTTTCTAPEKCQKVEGKYIYGLEGDIFACK